MNIEKITEIANRILTKNKMFSQEDGDKVVVKPIDEEKVYAYIETSKKGFGHMIIGKDLSYLWGTSAISYENLLKEYNSGRRSQ